MTSYLVCATPRSGSTLLCELLKETGVAGRPEEYFEARVKTGLPPHPGDYLADLPRTGAGIRDDPTPPRAPAHSSLIGLGGYREHLERTWRLGTTPNGVFGAKIMWRHLPDLHAFAGRLPEYAGFDLHELLDRLFCGPHYVWVTRSDKVRQAVSLWRALQTRSWRLDNASESGAPTQLLYRFEGINHLVRSLTEDDDQWRAFFAERGIDVVRISYEDQLEQDPEGAVRSVLDRLGVQPPARWRAREPMRRQADQLSDEWVATYHRDAAAAAARQEEPAVGLGR
jgi:LPS sulfotransferase NodH